MKTIKFFIITLVIATLSSCNLDINLIGRDGNGNVTTHEREVTGDFSKVKGAAGLKVYLTKGKENKITVEADENLHEIIDTEIVNGKLTVTTSENIGRSKAKKVYITYTDLDEIGASSGADVIADTVIETENLTLDASSGAELSAEIFSKNLYLDSSSGASIKVTGKATNINADASSGSEIDAKNLLAINCNAEVSSGADMSVHVKERLEANASSGGNLDYYGNPSAINSKDSSSGRVRKM